MLKKFAVTNFKGFKNRIELDLSNHRNYEFNGFAIKNGIIKDGIIYGPNGSGKSSIGFAIFDIVNHLSDKRKAPEFYIDCIYAGNPGCNMVFEYTFLFGDQLIEYSYSKNRNGVLVSESLKVNDRLVFNRNGAFFIDLNEFPMVPDRIKALEDNVNNISIVNYLLTSYPLIENHYLTRIKGFVDSMLWFRSLEDRGFIGLHTQPRLIEEFIISNDLINDFQRFLFDVSEQRFVFAKPKRGDKILLCVIDGSIIPFDSIRSTGTSSLMLLYFWFKNLNGASLVFIDEFDAFYHFKLSQSVCRKLFELDCQVLLTSHNTYLMNNDLLRPDCNFIINNNVVKPLCDCTDKELRWGHNIEKLYRGDAFEV